MTPIVYGVGNRGATLLSHELGVPFAKLMWGDKNRPVTRLFLEHALLISDVMVAIELACRQAGNVRLVTATELASRRVKGHQLVTTGTMDTLLVHPREVFRVAVVTSASAVILMHNHPSGDATPSGADITVTRELIKAGQLLRIEVLDHVIMGNPNHSSLRELGNFYS